MPGPEEKFDIIDQAMAGDDTDYGDKSPVTKVGEDNDDGVGDVQRQPDQQQPDATQPQQKPDPSQVQLLDPVQKGQQQQFDTSNLRRVGAQFADGKGNIVDKAGKIIARAGESARHWQEASRATAQVSNLTRQLTSLQQQTERDRTIIAQAREIAEMPTKMGITREDYNEGIALMARWRANPVEVAREIVARTLTFGHNVSDILGRNAGDALEMKAITSLVNQTTAPLKQQQEAAVRQTQQNQAAEVAYNSFMSKYPDADLHQDAIAALMGKGDNAEVAYYKVKNFAIQNGLDWDQPLGPQVAALRQSGGQRPTERRVPAPMVNGHRGNERQLTNEPVMADASEDWGSILRGVMSQTQ